jgi:hypothetical protein
MVTKYKAWLRTVEEGLFGLRLASRTVRRLIPKESLHDSIHGETKMILHRIEESTKKLEHLALALKEENRQEIIRHLQEKNAEKRSDVEW